jgi:CHAT domain-containing protein
MYHTDYETNGQTYMRLHYETVVKQVVGAVAHLSISSSTHGACTEAPVKSSLAIYRSFGGSTLHCAVLLLAIFSSHPVFSEEVSKFTSAPVDIQDRFETDTRSNYRIGGGVEWSQAKLKIPKGGGLAFVKTIEPEFRCEFDFWPTAKADGENCSSRFDAVISGHQLAIVVNRVQQKGQLLRQVLIAEIQPQPNSPDPKVTELTHSSVFSINGDVERWALKYKNGVVRLSLESETVAVTYASMCTAWCNAISISQSDGNVELSRFELHGREAGYSPEQRELYEKTNAMHVDAEKAKAAGDIRLAAQTEDQRIPLLEQAFGPDDVSIAMAHEWIGGLADSTNHWQAAKDRFEKASKVFAAALGPDHPYSYVINVRVGRALAELGEVDDAAKLATPAAISYFRLAQKGANYNDVFFMLQTILHKQAERRLESADYDGYVKCCQQIADLSTAIRGPKDAITKMYENDLTNAKRIAEAPADKQQKLAELILSATRVKDARAQDSPAVAEQKVDQLLADSRKLLGDDDPITGEMLLWACGPKFDKGDFGRATALAEEAVALRKKLYGEKDSRYAIAEGLLASTYSPLERYKDAAPLFKHALQTLSDNGEARDVDYARIQLEYGRHLIRIGEFKAAEEQLTGCLKIYSELGRSSDANAMKACERLVSVYRTLSEQAKCDQMLEFEKQLMQQAQGDVRATKIEIMLQDASNLFFKRQYDESIKKFQEAASQIEALNGKRNRGYEAVLASMIEVYVAAQDDKSAAKMFDELLEFERQKRESLFETYSPRQQFAQSATDRYWLNRLMTVATNHLISDEDAYSHLLGIKGAVTVYQRRSHLAASRPELKDLEKRRQDVASQLSALLAHDVTPEAAHKGEQLLAERDSIDRDMSAKSAAYRQVSEKITPQQIRDLLPANVAIVDYVEFERPPNWLEQVLKGGMQPQLAVFVVTKKDGPKLVNLGSSAEIETAFLDWLRAISREKTNLGDSFDPKLELETDRLGARVRELIWDPIAGQLSDADTVVISPDGVLLACPFSALPMDAKPTYLIEQKALSQIGAVALLPELLRRKADTSPAKLLVVGGVNYDLNTAKTAAADTATPLRIGFDKLPRSGEKIVELYKKQFSKGTVRELTGDDASEPNIRAALPGTSTIHLATHGFSVPFSVLQGTHNTGSKHPAIDPLIAGIALAGANRGVSQDDAADGILWASEISTLNLDGTDLVTLLACETALGDMVPGEGMQGCQRALTVAGAQSSLTSTWSVMVGPAELVMDRFYDNLWTKKQTKAQALQQATQFLLRNVDWKRGRKASDGVPHRCPPWLWSSWIVSGDWR